MLLLPAEPPVPLSLTGPVVSLRRLAPRPDWAPPAEVPPACRQVVITATDDGSAWGAVMLRGGDCLRDLSATHVADLAGPVSADHAAADFAGATEP